MIVSKPIATRLPLRLFLFILSLLGTYIFIAESLQKGFLADKFVDALHLKLMQPLPLVTTTSFVFVVITIGIYLFAYLIHWISSRRSHDKLEQFNLEFFKRTKSGLCQSIYWFIVFEALYYQLLIGKNSLQKPPFREQLPSHQLMPFWYLTAFFLYILSIWIEPFLRIEIQLIPKTIGVILMMLLLAQCYSDGFIERIYKL